VAVITLVLLYFRRAAEESGPSPRIDHSDPYLLAYLRGGKNEALRVATVVLVDRGLLVVDEKNRTLAVPARFTSPSHLIERALMRHFTQAHLATTIFDNLELAAVCDRYERRLSEAGLLPDAERRAARRRLLLRALTILIGLSLLKIVVALSRGRTNIIFLLILTIAAVIFAVKLANPRRTTRGDAMLDDLRLLFGRLRDGGARVTKGGATADAALLAAVFGVGALPIPEFAFAHKLYPRASSQSAAGCGSSCGSGCGGGGGGGGCGGCGGGGGD
jgi:uncharacterized protein (TIGR04222 family)